MLNRSAMIVLSVIFSLISLYYLSFTFASRNFKKEAETIATGKDGKVDIQKKQRYTDSLWNQPVYLGSTLKEVTEREINLGLDLQGGMHVILEVSPVEIVRSLAGNSQDPQFNQAIEQTLKDQQSSQKRFVDLFYANWQKTGKKLNTVFASSVNRGKINSQTSDREVLTLLNTEVESAIDRSFKILRTRVDKFGVTNPNLQRIPGTGRIQVELPGVDNPERVRKLLSGAAKLEFLEVAELSEYAPSLQQVGELLLAEQKIKTGTTQATSDTTKASGSLAGQLSAVTKKDSTKKDTSAANTAGAILGKYFIQLGNSLGATAKDTSRVNALLSRAEVKALLPQGLQFIWSVKSISNTTNTNEPIFEMTAVRRSFDGKAILDGDVVTDARQDMDQLRGGVEVLMQMNSEGARKWRNITASNIGKRIAIVLDNYVYSAPNIQGEIPNGSSSISGSFTVEEAQDLANVLKAGKLPAPTKIVEEAVVGATLGSESVSSGILSSLAGLFVVLIFMVLYYSRSGVIANIALLINLFFLMGLMATLRAVLTLPGIAGIVLTIGMAVDANVLVYERIKEELAEGKGLKLAITDGFKNALSAIIDSNVTTFLTGIILLVFGTGLIKGFAVTLVYGIITSLIAALIISRIIIEYWVDKGNMLSFTSNWAKNLFKDSNFDFVSRRKMYYIISSTIIAAGIISMIFKGFGLGVDFKGGRSYIVRFEKDVNTDQVRKELTTAFAGSPEVKTFGGSNQVKITTSYQADASTPEADKAVEAKLYEGLAKITGNKGNIESSQKIGPAIAYDTMISAIWSILLAVIVVFGYIFIRFKKLAFGYGAVVALFHDVLIILAIFSIFNGLLPFSLDVDQAFVGAVLTIMGYSMNDTIVVFDRVREYLNDNKGKKESIPVIINNALNSTLSRTAVTGLSTMFVLLVLLVFGGETIRGFSFAMFIGVIVGTYSSLFVATPIVVDSLTNEQAKDAAKELAVAETSKAKNR